MDRPSGLFSGMLVLGASLVISSLIAASAVRAVKRAGDEVSVTGSARQPITSDFIVWRCSVSTQSSTLPQAYQELARHSARVRAFLKDQGIADSAVIFRPTATYPMPEFLERGRETGRIIGYRLTQSFEIHSSDVEGVTRLSQASGQLINEGVPLVSQPLEYLYTKLADVRVQMLAEATKDARARAEALAKAAGSEVGPVRNIRMGVFQITPRYSTEVADYGINDVSSLEKAITAVVRVTFAVK
jgi:hypothetical protein